MNQLDILIEIILRFLDRGVMSRHDEDLFRGVYRNYYEEAS